MKKKGTHDRTIDNLVLRLKAKHYPWIKRHWKYCVPPYTGEVDVISYSGKGNRIRFYEIKSRDSTKNYFTAVAQYSRFRKAFPELNSTGVYVTPTTVRRIAKI